MKFVGILALVFGLSTYAETNPSELHLGFAPTIEANLESSATKKISEALSKQMGIPIKAIVAQNQGDLHDKLMQKKVDFAFLTAVGFVENEQKIGLKVLLKKIWSEPYYFSVILVDDKSKIKKVSDLKGKRIAFVDKASGSGFLYPQVYLKKTGIDEKDFKEVVFSGGHLESVRLLENHKVDAIAVFSDDVDGKRSAWHKFRKDSSIGVRKVWSSEPIPNDPLCVRQDFYDEHPKLTHTLMFALIDVIEGLQKEPDVKSLMGSNSFQPATSRQYDAVREMLQILGSGSDAKNLKQ